MQRCRNQIPVSCQSRSEIICAVRNFQSTGIDQLSVNTQCAEFWYAPRMDALAAYPVTKLFGTLQDQDAGSGLRHARSEYGTGKSTTNNHQIMSHGAVSKRGRGNYFVPIP